MIKLTDKTGQKLTFAQALQKGWKRMGAIFLDAKLMLLRWTGHIPSHALRKTIYRLAGIIQTRNIVIGQDTIIGDHCFLDGRAL